jgi:LPXTG-site transpeptidase (sortase) family protein
MKSIVSSNLKEKIRRLWKPFFVFFLISFLIFNWNEVSWIFNYRVVSHFFSETFKKDDSNIDFSNPKGPLGDFEYTEKENSIEIPKIEIKAPLIFPETSDNELIYGSLDKGVVHFPESALPGESGRTELLGHSAPENWPKIKYDWVFSNIVELENGDQVLVYYDNKKYVYEVKETVFLERGEEITNYPLTNSENMLVLISCWPPGKDLKRIAVVSELLVN